MKYTELKADISNGDCRIYLFEGEDAYFSEHGEEQVKNAFLSLPELNYAAFDGANLKGGALATLTSAMSACPFMSEKRIIRVGEFYPSEADYEKYLKTAFENCPDTTILIIVNRSAGKGAQLKRKKCITYVDCSHADEDTVTRWVYATLKRAGVASDAQACRLVAQYCLCDMSRVAGETNKLILSKINPVTVQTVDDIVYKDADYRIYEMTDAVAVKNYSRFITILSELSQKSAERPALVSALYRYFKNLLIILTSDEDRASLASKLKMPEFALKRSYERARSFGRDRLLAYTSALYNFSADMRSGKLSPDGAFFSSLAAILFA